MVLQKRLDYELNGHLVQIKRGARSARRRATFQRRVEGNQMCAFDLLATIAGDLLLHEKKNPFMFSEKLSGKDQQEFVKEECQDTSEPFKAKLSDEDCVERCQGVFAKECQDANNSLKGELSDEGSSDLKCFSNLTSQVYNENCCFKEPLHPEIHGHSHISLMVANSSCLERVAAEMLVGGKNHDAVENLSRKVELGFCRSPEISDNKIDGDVRKLKEDLLKFDKAPIDIGNKMCCYEDPLSEKPPAQISSGGNAKLSCRSLFVGCDNVQVVSRDDDENFSGCAYPAAKTKSFRPLTRVGDQSIRKTLAAKYCKVSQQSKHDTHSNSVLNGNLKPIYSNRKNCYKRQRSQMNIPFKKRKFFNYSSVSNCNGFVRNGDTYYSPGNDKKNITSKASRGMHKDPKMSSLEAHQHSVLGSRDSHVKLRIKSFRVPELFIEIPETETIGSLKRSVMEAVTAVLGGGLRVGVILQGKKVRDDSKTLLQTGISHDNHLDALGFTLEPISSTDMPQPLTRCPSSVVINHRTQGCSDVLTEHQVTSLGNLVESDHDSAPSPIKTSVNKSLKDSRALVTVPEMGMEALTMLPVQKKSKRPETVQRRIRRPFSVTEVEALVQAVEKLGTGRWRDVKLRAFDNAKHRTYVDLKDKWKTLVHTARISPQQRRGEPVPQELLDRVLTAHAFWSQQQSKQQLKHKSETCLFLQ